MIKLNIGRANNSGFQSKVSDFTITAKGQTEDPKSEGTRLGELAYNNLSYSQNVAMIQAILDASAKDEGLQDMLDDLNFHDLLLDARRDWSGG